ncbi:hypothetical protein BG28_01500 [Nesterenkonia sp. AN1]|uniref:malate synthase n=1 Tax=Nesterenkonia aurantiaca TaxID=1436010 RepID=A0A4R7FY56_9MICC|nr:hypothetical protein [Nesterenkonia]EXF26308.1 hypothetical protein BG28_01500 [Nesterenkonia sp. AN1]TDS83764.1 malate synthase [Nesterenkonia aurantiaca]
MNAQTSTSLHSSTEPRNESVTDPTEASVSSGITINGITLTAPRAPRQNEVFTADALTFLSTLHREFGTRIAELQAPELQPQRNFAPSPTGRRGSAEEAEASWKALVERYLVEPPAAFATPRRLTRSEDRIFSNGQPLSAGLVDFALHIQRRARRLVSEGRAPFISLLGIEGEEELEIWQEMFTRAEELVGLPAGTIRAITFSAEQDDAGGAVLLQKRAR